MNSVTIRKRIQGWVYPLDRFDKTLIGFLAVWTTVCVIIFAIVPSWEWASATLTNLVILALVWQVSFYRGCWHKFRPIADLGAVVGEQLHTHGELLITKHGGQYRIIPLHDVERNT